MKTALGNRWPVFPGGTALGTRPLARVFRAPGHERFLPRKGYGCTEVTNVITTGAGPGRRTASDSRRPSGGGALRSAE